MIIVKKFKKWLKQAPERKVYIEVITASLTVPVLITVLLTNLSNLNSKKPDTTPEQPTKQEIVLREIPSSNQAPQVSASEPQPTQQSCKKEIGPVSISYPQEGQIISDNPVNIIVKYDNETYCSVVWSYRVNNGNWSEYSSNSISLYDMQSGNKKIDLRVQSTVNQEQEMITRNFVYENTTSSPVASQSAQ